MKFFDSHAHYWDERFAKETESGVEELLSNLFENSVSGIVNVGTNLETTMSSIAQAKRFPQMYAAGGFHPGDLPDTLSASDVEALLRPLFEDKENKLVSLGEIGLDYHYLPFDKSRQIEFFEAQLSLAKRLSVPVIIHDREAHGDCFDTVRRYPDVCGVFHSYSGSPEMAKDLVRRGYMISFSGTLTFKNARTVKEVAASLPKESMMIETDAPYLTPHPYRGRLNHSGYLCYTAAALAEAWGISQEDVAEITHQNAQRFFQI